MRIRIENLSKTFGRTPALEGIHLDIESRELFFLLGPSGCGKTTLLRLIAGFYPPDQGRIFFGEACVNDVPPHKRNTGMVFQNYALWPHLSVAENVAYGLDVRGVSGNERKSRVHEALEIVRMEALGDRMPNQLSGGQQQRVALARALVIRPDALLLDEPLSNLDARLRLEMRDEIRRIHAETRITTCYVTHDQKEALSLADRITVLNRGRIEQIGEAREIYRSPANRFVADFMGETNWLPGRVEEISASGAVVSTPAGLFRCTSRPGLEAGQSIQLGFRPESVLIGQGPENSFDAMILMVTYLGDTEQYELSLPGGARIKATEQNPLHIRRCGAVMPVHIRSEDVLLLPESRNEP